MTKKTPTPVHAAAAKASAAIEPKVILNGTAFRPTALKVGALKRAMVGFADLQQLDSNDPHVAAEMLDLMASTVHKALLPNHPDLTQEVVEDMAEQVELGQAFGLVLRLSGAKDAVPGEVARLGR